jgi:DNA-binding response OmpR family regulator
MKLVRVLLIEDNPADVELIREALNSAELEPVFRLAADFEEAKISMQDILAGETAPEVILLDLNLPKGSGLELLQIFRASAMFQRIPVIVVSSSSAPRDRDRAAQLGALHYFRKPTELDEFMRLGQLVLSSLSLAG